MITEIQKVGEVVLQQVSKPDGTVVRYQYGRPGDATSIIHVQSLEEGRKAIALPVYTIVDRNGEAVVRKVMKSGKLLGYEYSVTGVEFTMLPTLTEARKAIGKAVKA